MKHTLLKLEKKWKKILISSISIIVLIGIGILLFNSVTIKSIKPVSLSSISPTKEMLKQSSMKSTAQILKENEIAQKVQENQAGTSTINISADFGEDSKMPSINISIYKIGLTSGKSTSNIIVGIFVTSVGYFIKKLIDKLFEKQKNRILISHEVETYTSD